MIEEKRKTTTKARSIRKRHAVANFHIVLFIKKVTKWSNKKKRFQNDGSA